MKTNFSNFCRWLVLFALCLGISLAAIGCSASNPDHWTPTRGMAMVGLSVATAVYPPAMIGLFTLML